MNVTSVRGGIHNKDVLLAAFASLPEIAYRIDQVYADKAGISRDADAYAIKLIEEIGEIYHAYLQLTGRRQKDEQDDGFIRRNLANQVSDALMVLMMFAYSTGADVQDALKRKWLKFLPEIALNPDPSLQNSYE